MSAFFSDWERLKEEARENLRNGVAQIRRWWSKKYNRPPHDPLFLGQSIAQHQLEMLEDLLYREREVVRDIEEDGDPEGRLLKELNAIREALDEAPETQDDLIDEWERDLEEGRMPDLDKMPGE